MIVLLLLCLSQLSTIWAETADNARSAARTLVLGGLSGKHYGLNNFWTEDKIDVIFFYTLVFSKSFNCLNMHFLLHGPHILMAFLKKHHVSYNFCTEYKINAIFLLYVGLEEKLNTLNSHLSLFLIFGSGLKAVGTLQLYTCAVSYQFSNLKKTRWYVKITNFDCLCFLQSLFKLFILNFVA